MYEDKPIYYDNWDIDMFYTEKSWPVDDRLVTSYTSWMEEPGRMSWNWLSSTVFHIRSSSPAGYL